jgi:hypothetical protein
LRLWLKKETEAMRAKGYEEMAEEDKGVSDLAFERCDSPFRRWSRKPFDYQTQPDLNHFKGKAVKTPRHDRQRKNG